MGWKKQFVNQTSKFQNIEINTWSRPFRRLRHGTWWGKQRRGRRQGLLGNYGLRVNKRGQRSSAVYPWELNTPSRMDNTAPPTPTLTSSQLPPFASASISMFIQFPNEHDVTSQRNKSFHQAFSSLWRHFRDITAFRYDCDEEFRGMHQIGKMWR